MTSWLRATRLAVGASEALPAFAGPGGQVLTSHRRVANLRAPSGRLVALHGPDVPATPFSVLLDVPTGWTGWPAPGTPVRSDLASLRVGAIEVSLAGAHPCPPRPAPRVDLDAARTLAPLLDPFARGGAFGAWWEEEPGVAGALERAGARTTRRALHDAAGALSSGATGEPPTTVLGLIGLGPGGTPAGDDVLLGFLAAWRSIRPDGGAQALAARLADVAPGRTTPLAAEFYLHLARDRRADLLDDLLLALGGGSADTLVGAARRLAAYGATSGGDTISGVFACLRALAASGDPLT